MNPEEPEPGDAAWRFAGHWFVVLGIGAILSMPIAWAQDRGGVDLSGILLFWLASALFRRSAGARRVALGLAALFLGTGAAALGLSVAGHAGRMTAMGARNPAPDLAAATLGAFALLILPPVFALLKEDAKRLAGVPPTARKPGRFALFYVLGLSIFLLGAQSFPALVRRESMTLGGTRVRGGGTQEAFTVELLRSDGGLPGRTSLTLYVVATGPSAQRFLSGEGSLDVNKVRLSFASERAWIFLPPRPPEGPNLVLIDGAQARRLPRRVTLADVKAVEASLAGFADAADLERRLLSALPE